MADDIKKEDVKTFSFSKEDLEFLQLRQILINQHRLIITDIDFAMQQFIIQSVLPRLSVNPQEYAISYNVSDNKLTCTKKPPEIIKPDNKIVIPK